MNKPQVENVRVQGTAGDRPSAVGCRRIAGLVKRFSCTRTENLAQGHIGDFHCTAHPELYRDRFVLTVQWS